MQPGFEPGMGFFVQRYPAPAPLAPGSKLDLAVGLGSCDSPMRAITATVIQGKRERIVSLGSGARAGWPPSASGSVLDAQQGSSRGKPKGRFPTSPKLCRRIWLPIWCTPKSKSVANCNNRWKPQTLDARSFVPLGKVHEHCSISLCRNPSRSVAIPLATALFTPCLRLRSNRSQVRILPGVPT
jgi:hypothetical protein